MSWLELHYGMLVSTISTEQVMVLGLSLMYMRVGLCFCHYIYIFISVIFADRKARLNSVDPDQTAPRKNATRRAV